MTRQLPPKPSIKHLRLEAKNILKAHDKGERTCCGVLKHLPRFANSSDESILAEEVGLQEVQHALAKDYGVKNWCDLRQAVGTGAPRPEDRVKRENGKVWIEGVGKLRFAQGMDEQFMGALTRVLEVLDEDTAYEYLMGVSGAAFRLHFWMPQWCPSSNSLMDGYDHSVPLMAALGFKAQRYNCGWYEPDKVEPVRPAVQSSIDRGWPVIGSNLEGRGRHGVVVGYHENDKPFLCRTYDDTTDEYSVSAAPPAGFFVLEKKVEPLPRRQAVVRSLEIAVELAHTKTYKRDGQDQASGFAAYEKWAGDLANDAVLKERDEGVLGMMVDANAYCWLFLVEARTSAVKYLRSIANEFTGACSRDLLTAAQIYEHLRNDLVAGYDHVPRPWDEAGREAWKKSRERQQAEAATLSRCLALEREAVGAIEKALAAMG